MAKLEVLVALLLPLVILQLHWHTTPTVAAATRMITPTVHRTLASQQPQQTAGGELAVVVRSPAPGPSPTLYSRNSDKDGQMSSQVPTLKQDPGLCNYKVTTKTGDQWSADTHSTISLRLENSEKDKIYMVLTPGGIHNGAEDTFTKLDRCVPRICKMTLYTDSRGWLPCWYVVFVDVTITPVLAGTPGSGVSDYQQWQVEEWLPAHEWSSAASLVREHCPKSNTR